mmetsp:Transcript_192/g.418  ORF Transcript_192/g.418 Transcript_192/m.418 type:complete len:237 (+) Transcript_192:186-896(+)
MLGQVRSRPANASKVEPSIHLARLRDSFRAVPLCQGDHGIAMLLEERHVRVHAPSSRGPKTAAGVALRSLGRTSIVDDMRAHVVRQRALLFQAFRKLCVRNVSRNDDGAGEGQARLDGILCQQVQDVLHGPVQVDRHGIAPQGHRWSLLEETTRVLLELLDVHTVVRDLAQHLAVSAAGDADAHGAGCAVPWHADDADVVHEVLASKLRTDAKPMAHLHDLLLPLDVTVRAAVVVA